MKCPLGLKKLVLKLLLQKKMENGLRKAVSYLRVSSKEQQELGFSIPSQKRLLREYAKANNLEIVQEFSEAETAKKAGRKEFGKMIKFLKRGSSPKIVLVEKTDRLYRNIKDWVILDDLDLEIHLVKENLVLSVDSRSSEKFMHGIKVLMAKNFIDNLSEESSKGMREKARQGLYPSNAPLGYLNDPVSKTIHPDNHRAPEVRRLFEHYAAKKPSYARMADFAESIGLKSRRGFRVSPELIRKLLRNPIYIGDVPWNGEIFKGKHEPLISRDLFLEVQGRLGGSHNPQIQNHHFAFRGLLTCGNCGCLITPERKKGKYVYYHCTHNGSPCTEKSIREEGLMEQLGESLKLMAITPERAEWLRQALQESHLDQKEYQKKETKRATQGIEEIHHKQGILYDDKLAGVIPPLFWEKKFKELEEQKEKFQADIERISGATADYYEDGIKLIELGQRAYSLYVMADEDEKRNLLDFVYQNCTLKGGKVSIEFRKPFDLYVDAALLEKKLTEENETFEANHPVWYPRRDSNPRPPD